MNSVPDETTPGPPRVSWWRKVWRRFVTHWEGTTRNKTVYKGAVFIAIGFVLVSSQINTINDGKRESDNRDAAQAIYSVQSVAWLAANTAFVACKDGVGRSDIDRAQWEATADFLASKYGEGAVDFIRQGPLLSGPPRSLAECIDPGPVPTPPK